MNIEPRGGQAAVHSFGGKLCLYISVCEWLLGIISVFVCNSCAHACMP
jgi:hypothetical protein